MQEPASYSYRTVATQYSIKTKYILDLQYFLYYSHFLRNQFFSIKFCQDQKQTNKQKPTTFSYINDKTIIFVILSPLIFGWTIQK